MESSCVDDCYFYYYSSCTKGSECPYRHCEAALGTETVCTLWREGTCFRSNCKFRHMESRINRASIPCYWENQPGGCRKPHCVFFHCKDRFAINVLNESVGLILPVSSQSIDPSMALDSSTEEKKREPSETVPVSSPNHIPPVVVSLGEGEESDTESTVGTPMKQTSALEKRICSPIKILIEAARNDASCEKDLGIKTLEQIKMAKIHRESEHFYNSGKNDVTDADILTEYANLETHHCEPEGFHSQGDLRNILKKKRDGFEKELHKGAGIKRTIFLKSTTGAREDLYDLHEVTSAVNVPSKVEGTLGFRVKTLREIRKEKENKQSTTVEEVPSEEPNYFKTTANNDGGNAQCIMTKTQSQGLKRKLKRKPIELYKSVKKDHTGIDGILENQESEIHKVTGNVTKTEVVVKEANVEIAAEPVVKDADYQNNFLENTSSSALSSKVTQLMAADAALSSKAVAHALEEEKPLENSGVLEKVNDDFPPFKRNRLNNCLSTMSSKNSSDDIHNSDLQKKVVQESSKHSALLDQNGVCMESDAPSVEGNDVEMQSEEEEKTNDAVPLSSSLPVPVKCEKRPFALSTVDELDTLFLGPEGDVSMDDIDNTDTKAEDLFLEIEQMLQS